MRIRPSALIMALLVGCALVVTPVNAAAAAVPAYQIAQQIALPAAGAGVAVDSDRGLVYVAGRGSAAVWVYDEATLTLQRTIAVPNEPYNLAVGPTGLVYVTQYTGNNLPGTVSVISPVTNTVVATSPVGNSPVGVTVSQDGDRLYVANLSSNFLSVFDLTVPESPVAEPSIPLPRGSETVSQSADGSTLFVPNNGGSVFVVAAGAGTLLSTWTGFNSAHQVSLSTDGRQAFVSQQLGGPMPVFSVSTNTRTGTLPLTTTYYQSIDPGVGAGFITQPFTSGGTLAIIDQADGSVLQSLSGVPTAYYPAADSKTHSVFVTSIASSTLTKIVPTLAVIEDPVSQTIPDGSTATFSAAASGAAPIATTCARSAGRGKCEEEGRAAGGRTLDLDGTAGPARDIAHERESEAEAAQAPALGRAGEALEDLIRGDPGDARSLIGHTNGDVTRVRADADGDSAAGRRVLYRVVEQSDEDADQCHRGDPGYGPVVDDGHRESHLVLVRDRRDRGDRRGRCTRHFGLPVVVGRPLGRYQQVVQHISHGVCISTELDQAGADVLTPVEASLKHLDATRHRRQGRAQLMAGIGHEVALSAQCLTHRANRPSGGDGGHDPQQHDADDAQHDHHGHDHVDVDDEVVACTDGAAEPSTAVFLPFPAGGGEDHGDQDPDAHRNDHTRRDAHPQPDRQCRSAHPRRVVAHEGAPARYPRARTVSIMSALVLRRT